MKRWALFAGLFILCGASLASPKGHIYRNPMFGITLPVPTAAELCPTMPYDTGVEHGKDFLLGTRDISLCRKYSGKRWIEVFGSYNTVEDTKTLHLLLQSDCQDEMKRACEPAPPGLHIPAMRSEAGRMTHPDGSIEILVVTQAGKPDPDFDPKVPGYQYELSLNTNAQSLDEDLVVFREVLRTVRIAPHRR